MHLLLFIHSLRAGGAERVTANLANYWCEHGRQVTLVTLEREETDFYRLAPAVRRIALDCAEPSGGTVRAVRQNLLRASALRAAIRVTRPNAAISMMSTSNVLLALAAWGLDDTHFIGAEHTYPPQLPLGTMWEMLRKHLYARLSAVVALTPEGAAWLQSHTRAGRVAVIPNAAFWPLPEQPPVVAPESIFPRDRRILLSVGRLSEEKNFDLLIDVFARVRSSQPDWDLVILGEGPERARLEAHVSRAGLDDRVHLPGRVGNVGAWYARADLYALTSRFEGFPNTLVEAMSYGLPAISFDCDTGPRDIIRAGVDGLLLPPGDLPALEAAMTSLMADPVLRETYAQRAVQVRERFSVERIARMWDDLLASCEASALVRPERKVRWDDA